MKFSSEIENALLIYDKLYLGGTCEVRKYSSLYGIDIDALIEYKISNGSILILLEDSLEVDLYKVFCKICNKLYKFKVRLEVVPQIIVLEADNKVYVFKSDILRDYYDTYSNEFNYVKDANMQFRVSNNLYNYIKKDENINNILSTYISLSSLGRRNFRKVLIGEVRDIIADNNLIGIDINMGGLIELLSRFYMVLEDVNISNRDAIKLMIDYIKNGSTDKLDIDKIKDFDNYYNSLSADIKEKIFRNSDNLISELDRRRKGDFYTPKVWVDEAHRMADNYLGSGWRDKYIVWDCACGTKNLTRDYVFGKDNRNLISTTLYEQDITISKDLNKGSISFQYDFLNDDVYEFIEIEKMKELRGGELKLEDFKDTKFYKCGGRDILERLIAGDGLVFFINPPYGSAGSTGKKSSGIVNNAGISSTKIMEVMKQKGVGIASVELSAQFIFRIVEFKRLFNKSDIKLILFSKVGICTMDKMEVLREYCGNNSLSIKEASMFCASEFDGCSDSWGVLISIWDNSDSWNNEIECKLKERKGRDIKIIGTKKLLYNKKLASKFIKDNTVDYRDYIDVPNLTSALKVKETNNKLPKNYLGGLCERPTVQYNVSNTYIVSAATSDRNIAITENNILDVLGLFTAKKLIVPPYANWTNEKDNYMEPNINSLEYSKFIYDSVIYSLFNTSSCQSSLRGVKYKGKEWDIINHFFWLSADEIRDLANKYGNKDVLLDIERTRIDKRFEGKPCSNERYIYIKIKEIDEFGGFSEEAKLVLQQVNRIVNKTFKYRQKMSELSYKELRDLGLRGNKIDGKDWHINTWDAGWYQIKGLALISEPEELREFNKLYKKLGDKLRPMVYELGYLSR